jgi:hypothetical protein
MKLMNLYSNHFAKNKCPNLIFVDTQSKYMKKTKEQMEKGEGKMKAKGKRKAKTKETGKTEKATKEDTWAKLDDTDLTNEKDDLVKHWKEKERRPKKKGANASPPPTKRRSKRCQATTK